MNIKIESGANVQITDKPIYNIYGDVVKEKNVLPQVPFCKKKKKQSEKTESRKPDFNPVTATFKKDGTVLIANFTLVFQFLVEKKWIANNSNPDVFLALFSGYTSEKSIVWLKAKGVLRDLFKMLIDEKIISCPKGYSYLQIVSSHFTDQEGNFLTDLNSGYTGKKIQTDLSHILVLMKAKYQNEDD